MRDAIWQRLADDSVMKGILTGGLYTATHISPQSTPDAFDEYDELMPTGLLKFENLVSLNGRSGAGFSASRLHFCLYLYERIGHQDAPPRRWRGYKNIEEARERAFDLLHRWRIVPVNEVPVVGAGGQAPYTLGDTAWYVLHENDVLDARDEALDCRMARSCYYVNMARRGACRNC